MSLTLLINKWKLKLFLVGFLALRFPPMYIFPPLKSAFLTTQSIARIVFLGLFIAELYLIWANSESRLKRFVKKNKIAIFLILLFLVELSLGVLFSINTTGYISRYKDVYMGVIMFFLGGVYIANLDKISRVVLIGLGLSVLYQGLLLLFPNTFATLARVFVYDRHLTLVLQNIERGRTYIETFDEAVFLIPVIWLLKRKASKEKAYTILLFVILGFFAFVSNFRTRILLLGISLLGYLYYTFKIGILKNRKKISGIGKTIISGFLILCVVAFAAETYSLKTFGFSYIDRLAFRDKREDVETISFRVRQLKEAYYQSKANMGFGVGLGNYYDYLPASREYSYFHRLFQTKERVSGAAEYVHNIFGTFLAEGGLWSFSIFSILILKFIYDDYNYLWRNKNEKTLLVFVFWGLFAYAMLHPFVPFSLQGIFWFVRGSLTAEESIEEESIEE